MAACCMSGVGCTDVGVAVRVEVAGGTDMCGVVGVGRVVGVGGVVGAVGVIEGVIVSHVSAIGAGAGGCVKVSSISLLSHRSLIPGSLRRKDQSDHPQYGGLTYQSVHRADTARDVWHH